MPMNAKPTPPAAAPLSLDEQALARLRELDPDGKHGVVLRVMRTFESSLLRLLTQAVEARDRGDLPAIGHIAHTLKSSSGSVGALALSACCADIERAVRNGETADLAPRLENLLSEGERALAAVRAMLRT
jgi:HPt (histidine-containing phosphotransfer) domain-containing protein